MKKLLGLFLVALLCATPSLFAQRRGEHPAGGPAPIHNGLWWHSKSSIYRNGFVIGYKSGSEHGAGHPLDIDQFPSSELVDGLDNFYRDFRNRNILVDDALNYVQDQLRGVSDDKLNAEVLKMRAASVPASNE